LTVAGGGAPPAPIVLLTVVICEPLHLADDLAVGRIDEQLGPVASLGADVQGLPKLPAWAADAPSTTAATVRMAILRIGIS
jgi:hypothetical protein